jgi:hypothetical protein
MGSNSALWAPPKKSAHDQDVTPTYLDLGFRTPWGLKLRMVTSVHAFVLRKKLQPEQVSVLTEKKLQQDSESLLAEKKLQPEQVSVLTEKELRQDLR